MFIILATEQFWFNATYLPRTQESKLNTTDEDKEDILHRYVVSPRTDWERKSSPPYNLTIFKVKDGVLYCIPGMSL